MAASVWSSQVLGLRQSGATVEIGGIPIFLQTDNEDFRRLIEDRYAGFVNSAAEPSCQLEVHLVPPTGRMAEDDVQVSRSGSVWRIERGDFCAEFDARSRRGWVRQSSNPYSLDAAMRIIHSLILAEEGGFLVHAASGVRNGRAFVFAGVSGAGKTTISRLAPPGRHAAHRRDFLHSERRERLSCLWHSFRWRIGARGNEREGAARGALFSGKRAGQSHRADQRARCGARPDSQYSVLRARPGPSGARI